jgi:hypothetical protein
MEEIMPDALNYKINGVPNLINVGLPCPTRGRWAGALSWTSNKAMKYLARWVVAFAFTGAAFSISVQAGSFDLPTHGGGGGDSFRLNCGNDAVLVGVSGRAGDWLNRLRARCTRVAANGRWLGDVFTTGTVGGGGGTADFTATCPINSAIRGITGGFGWYVNRLALQCELIGAFGGGFTIISAAGSQSGDQSFDLEFCPPNMPARGFHGKAKDYVDSAGLICHAGTTPQLQVLAAPDQVEAVNLVSPEGPITAAVTPFVQLQWTDQSAFEEGFSIRIVRLSSGGEQTRERLPAAGVGSRQVMNINGLQNGKVQNGNFIAFVCADFRLADGEDLTRCSDAPVSFGISAFGTCSPTITFALRIRGGTGRVFWSHNCNSPMRFDVKLRCGHNPMGIVASTADGTARRASFSLGVGDGELQVCARNPGQAAPGFCSARQLFKCN